MQILLFTNKNASWYCFDVYLKNYKSYRRILYEHILDQVTSPVINIS